MRDRGRIPLPPVTIPDNVCDAAAAWPSSSRYANELLCRARWARVVRRASAPGSSGGGSGGSGGSGSGPPEAALPLDFDADRDLTPQSVARLARIIDEELFGGRLARLAGGALEFAVEDGSGGSGRATAAFVAAERRVVVYRAAFRRAVSLAAPVQVDGVYTVTRLAWLAHACGHELVHAVVAGSCSEQQQAAPLARASGGHGAAFRRLNRRLLGHHAGAYEAYAGWAKGGRRYVLS